MKRLAAGALALGLAVWFAAAWGQESLEASRPIRGTGEAGKPSSGVLTIQGIFQGRPVTVDFHHTAGALHAASLGHVTSVVHVTTGQSPHLTTFWVNCGATAAIAATPKGDTLGRRRDLILQNGGTLNIFVGGTHATVTTTTGWPLHAGTGATSRLVLPNYQGRVDCIAADVNQTLQIMEIWR